MICANCDHKIKSDPDWILIDRMNIERVFCRLECLVDYVDELAIEAEENSPETMVN